MRTALEAGVMPLPPVTIGQSDATALLRWLNAGAPPRTAADVCAAPTVDPAEAGADAADGGATLESSDEQGDAGGPAEDVLGANSATSDADDPDDAAPD